jgi:hypothetical protein
MSPPWCQPLPPACLTPAVALAIFAAAGVKGRLVFSRVMAAVVDRE